MANFTLSMCSKLLWVVILIFCAGPTRFKPSSSLNFKVTYCVATLPDETNAVLRLNRRPQVFLIPC